MSQRLIADALALGHPRLDVDQFPDGILLELHLGFVLCVCVQGSKHSFLVVVVTEMFRSDKLRSASRQVAELFTAFLDGNAVLLQEPVGKIFKARGTVQYRRNLSP